MLFKIKGTSKNGEYHDMVIEDGTTKEYRFEYNPDDRRYTVYELDSDREIVKMVNVTFSYDETKTRIGEGHWKLKGKFNDQRKD